MKFIQKHSLILIYNNAYMKLEYINVYKYYFRLFCLIFTDMVTDLCKHNRSQTFTLSLSLSLSLSCCLVKKLHCTPGQKFCYCCFRQIFPMLSKIYTFHIISNKHFPYTFIYISLHKFRTCRIYCNIIFCYILNILG